MAGSYLEAIRFGFGPAAGDDVSGAGLDTRGLLAQLVASHPADTRFVRPGLAERLALADEVRMARRSGGAPDVEEQLRAIIAEDGASWIPRTVAAVGGFRERLVSFWANRFAVAGGGPRSLVLAPHRDEAIRPRIAGRFADLLTAAILHPAMLDYLDATRSVGPNSRVGRRQGRGLNENLARELLELHTMGEGYGQDDVTELARLLTGLTVGRDGVFYDTRRGEPGRFTILGRGYGGPGTDGLPEILRFLEDVSQRPETAQSVGFALCRQFLADDPPAPAVAATARAFAGSGGDLMATYRALLETPEAADPTLAKVRAPFEYVVAVLRSLGLSGREADDDGQQRGPRRLLPALRRMGQAPFQPPGPDGWPEIATAWITPPLLAARVDWVSDLVRATGVAGDPAAFAATALGPFAGTRLPGLVSGAETRGEGIALVLASPEFMRR